MKSFCNWLVIRSVSNTVEDGRVLTVPSLLPNVGPANETKISAPQFAALDNPSMSLYVPSMTRTSGCLIIAGGSLEGVRT